MNARLASLALSLSLVGVAACGTEADPNAVHGRIDQLVPGIVDSAQAISDQVSPDDLALIPGGGAALAQLLDASALPSTGAAAPTSPSQALHAALAAIQQASALPRARLPHKHAALRTRRDSPPVADPGADLAKALDAQVFTAANYAGDGVYKLPAEVLCPTDETGAADADCAAQVALLKPTVRAELDGDDALDLTLVVGAQLEPISLHLAPGHAHLAIDLADVGAAATAASSIASLGVGDDGSTFALRGAISADLQITSGSIATFAINIDQAIHASIAAKGAAVDTAAATTFDTGTAAPAFRVQLDASNHALRGGVGINATTAHIPASADQQAVDLDLPGFGIAWNQQVGQPLELDLTLGNRTTELKVNGRRAVGIDLNPSYDRKLQIAIDREADTGAAIYTFAPALDLQVAVDHAVLGDTAPRYDVSQLAFRSTAGAAPALRVSTLADGTEQREVIGGALTIATNPAQYGAVIAAGQCIGAEDRSDDQGSYAVVVAATCAP
jgi:hypothetical protein